MSWIMESWSFGAKGTSWYQVCGDCMNSEDVEVPVVYGQLGNWDVKGVGGGYTI